MIIFWILFEIIIKIFFAYKLNYRKKYLFKDGENLKKNKRIALFIETSAKTRFIDEDFFADLLKKWFFQKKISKMKITIKNS